MSYIMFHPEQAEGPAHASSSAGLTKSNQRLGFSSTRARCSLTSRASSMPGERA
jgi:hypothetical protein